MGFDVTSVGGKTGWPLPSESLTTDVLVVGGGMAGALAALSAWTHGASVTLVRRSLGATALSSGAIDIAPDPLLSPTLPLGGRHSLHRSVQSLAAIQEGHPYAVLREHLPLLPDAMRFVEEQVEGIRLGNLDEENHCLPTPIGGWKLAGGGLSSIVSSDLGAESGRVGVVGFANHLEYDAEISAKIIQDACERAGLPCTVEPIVCDLPDRDGEAQTLRPFQVARNIEREPHRLASAVKEAAPTGLRRILFPPVLSRSDPAHVLSILERELALPCGEFLATRQSVPGMRLQGFLDGALESSQVRVEEGEVVSDLPRDVDSLRLRPPTPTATQEASYPIRAKAVILATGKFLAGGLRKGACIEETVLRLPVSLDGKTCTSSSRLTANDWRADQSIFRAGLPIDGGLRPLDERGVPVSPRIYACGDLLSGHDPATDGSGMGVSLFTGYLAGLFAAGVAGSH